MEAARAGEQGRGFATAAEAGKLARRSAAAAEEIKLLIGDSVDKVREGSTLVEQAGVTDIMGREQRRQRRAERRHRPGQPDHQAARLARAQVAALNNTLKASAQGASQQSYS